MKASLHEAIVNGLKSEYPGSAMYGVTVMNAIAPEIIYSRGFIGSFGAVFLGSQAHIVHEAPACVAGSVITMVAKETIDLGVKGQEDYFAPVRFYAKDVFSVTTRHLSIGDMKFLVDPEAGYISCKKLTLVETSEEGPEHFEIVKSWFMDDATEIEVVKRNS